MTAKACKKGERRIAGRCVSKKEIHESIDKVRDIKNCWLCDRIASYAEANIDDFIDSYEDEE